MKYTEEPYDEDGNMNVRTKFNIIKGDRDYDFESLFMAKFKSLNIKAKKLHFLKYEYKPSVDGSLKREF